MLGLAVVYGLLILAWPGLSDAYGTLFRGLARAVFSTETGRRELEFKAWPQVRGDSQMRIEIVNRELMGPDGAGPVRNLDLDVFGFWNSMALLAALIAATPISWQRKAVALLWGGLGIQAFQILTLAFVIRNESRYVYLIQLSPVWQNVSDKIQRALLSQFSLAVPVLLWITVTFRSGDRVGTFGVSKPSKE